MEVDKLEDKYTVVVLSEFEYTVDKQLVLDIVEVDKEGELVEGDL